MNQKIVRFFSLWNARARISYARTVMSRFTSGEKKVFFAALFLFAVSGVTLLVRGYYAVTVLVPTEGGEYVEGIVGQPVLINPILSQSNDVDRDISELVYSGLLASNGRGGVRPDLAEFCKSDAEGLIWSCILKDNIFWHDGEQFGADDVIFTVEAVQDPDTGSYLFNSWQGVVAERVSSLEVRFHLRTPYAGFEENLKALKILPRHIFESLPRANYRLSAFNLEPVGTGSFQYAASSQRKDGFITDYVFTRNKRYYRGPIFIERIILKFYQNDDEMLASFNRREIDGFGNSTAATLVGIRIPARVVSHALPRYFAVFFNSSVAPALSDGAVRRALDAAIDKASLVRFVFQEYASVSNSPVVRGMLGYSTSMRALEYDPEYAARILEGAGWRFDPGLSVRVKGADALAFDLVTPETPTLVRAAELVRDAWANIGVQANIVRVPLSEITRNYIQSRAYDMLLFGNIINFNTDLFAFWHSSQKFHPGLNLSLFDSKEADRLIEASRQTLNAEARAQYIQDTVSLITAQTPAIFLFSPDYLYVTNNTLRGVESVFLLTPSERFSQIGKWHVKETRVFK